MPLISQPRGLRRERSLVSESDAALVERTLDGDAKAFEALYLRYRPRIVRFALSRLGDPEEARDVSQEVFLEMHRCLASYRGSGSLWTWLCGIAWHRVQARWRGRPPVMSSLDDLREALLVAPSARIEETVDALRALERCTQVMGRRLSPDAQRIFRLHYIENQPLDVVGRLCNKKPPSVKVTLSRTRRTLRSGAPQVKQLIGS